MQIPSPRIFVITARDADAAVIFRRGPSDWFHLLKWDMADDTFQAGAWFKGSMYPEKCDLSPDGVLLLYFVLRGDHPGKGLTVELGWCAEQHASSQEVEGSTWSGRDRAGRLIYAREGKIFRRQASGLDLELTDLNGMTPDPKPAPLWASRELDEQQTNR